MVRKGKKISLLLFLLLLFAVMPLSVRAESVAENIANAQITLDDSDCIYSGESIEPEVFVRNSAGEILEKDIDYTLSYEKNINVGTGFAAVSGKGSYTGITRVSFTIKPQKIEGFTLADGPYIYAGKEIYPEPIVKNRNGDILKRGRDYSVSYPVDGDPDTMRTGEWGVVVEGIGNYTGRVRIDYNVEPGTLADVTIPNSTCTYTGEALKPEAVVLDSYGNEVNHDMGLYFRYEHNINVGEGSLRVRGHTNYEGTIYTNFTIEPRNLETVDQITLSNNTFTYTGRKITQDPMVNVLFYDYSGKKMKTYNHALKKGVDYAVSYEKSVNVGECTLVITGKGNYCGTVRKTVIVKPAKPQISKLTASKKAFNISWIRKPKQESGYQIQVSTNRNFNGKPETITISSNRISSCKINGLKSKKKYYARMRCYKTVNGKSYYSSWSTKKSVTVR